MVQFWTHRLTPIVTIQRSQSKDINTPTTMDEVALKERRSDALRRHSSGLSADALEEAATEAAQRRPIMPKELDIKNYQKDFQKEKGATAPTRRVGRRGSAPAAIIKAPSGCL